MRFAGGGDLAAKETIFLTGPAGKLETLVARPAEGEIRGTLTFVHPNPTEGGTNTNKVVTTVAKAFCKKGYACLLPNTRGTGDSDGAYADGAGEKDDAQAVFEAAKAMFPQARRRALGGFSFGGFVATLAAGACEPDFLILVAPAVNRHALKSPRDVALRFDTRLFFGSEDDVVPRAMFCRGSKLSLFRSSRSRARGIFSTASWQTLKRRSSSFARFERRGDRFKRPTVQSGPK